MQIASFLNRVDTIAESSKAAVDILKYMIIKESYHALIRQIALVEY